MTSGKFPGVAVDPAELQTTLSDLIQQINYGFIYSNFFSLHLRP